MDSSSPPHSPSPANPSSGSGGHFHRHGSRGSRGSLKKLVAKTSLEKAAAAAAAGDEGGGSGQLITVTDVDEGDGKGVTIGKVARKIASFYDECPAPGAEPNCHISDNLFKSLKESLSCDESGE